MALPDKTGQLGCLSQLLWWDENRSQIILILFSRNPRSIIMSLSVLLTIRVTAGLRRTLMWLTLRRLFLHSLDPKRPVALAAQYRRKQPLADRICEEITQLKSRLIAIRL